MLPGHSDSSNILGVASLPITVYLATLLYLPWWQVWERLNLSHLERSPMSWTPNTVFNVLTRLDVMCKIFIRSQQCLVHQAKL